MKEKARNAVLGNFLVRCWLRRFLFLIAVGSAVEPGSGWAQSGDDRSCWRPGVPTASEYTTERDYYLAQEEYYSQVTFYLSCLDTWARDAENRYREMLEAEIEVYAIEREDLLEEIRAFTRGLKP